MWCDKKLLNTSYSHQLRLLNWRIGSLVPTIVVVFVERPLTVQVAYWPVHFLGKASSGKKSCVDLPFSFQ